MDEGFVADGTFVGPFSSVDPHVSVELARVFKSPLTDVALVWALFGVYAAMYGQILFDREGLVAVLALVGFLACVGPVVPGQASRDGEGFPAEVALVRILALLVGLEVGLVGRSSCKALLARWALQGFGRRVRRSGLRWWGKYNWQIWTADDTTDRGRFVGRWFGTAGHQWAERTICANG